MNSQYIKLLESIFDFKSADDKINGKFVQVTAIADLQGFGIRHMTVPAGKYNDHTFYYLKIVIIISRFFQ